MPRRNLPPNRGGLKSRLDKAKKENMALRVLTNRQRRNLKDLTGIIIGVRRALKAGDTIRAFALVSGNIKYPPSAAITCDHELVTDFVTYCKHCKTLEL